MKFGLVVAVAAFGMASPVWAGDAQCIWDHIPAAQTQALVIEGLRIGVGKTPNIRAFLTDEAVSGALTACSVTTDTSGEAGSAFLGIFQQRVAEAALGQSLGLTTKQLDDAWKTLPAADIAALAAQVDQGKPNDDQLAAFNKLVAAMSARFNPTPDDASMAAYVYGRLRRARHEPNF